MKKGGKFKMDFSEVIKNRYSCKKFSDKKIEKEKLEIILEAGRVAPTAKNFQEQHQDHQYLCYKLILVQQQD